MPSCTAAAISCSGLMLVSRSTFSRAAAPLAKTRERISKNRRGTIDTRRKRIGNILTSLNTRVFVHFQDSTGLYPPRPRLLGQHRAGRGRYDLYAARRTPHGT